MSLNLKIFGVLKNVFLQWEACQVDQHGLLKKN